MSAHAAEAPRTARSSHYDEVEAVPWSDVLRRTYARVPDTLRYLTERSEYYAARVPAGDLDSYADPDVFRTIPLMEKEDERRCQELDPPFGVHMCAAEQDLLAIQASSGTTGAPTFFGLTARDKATWDRMITRTCWTAGMRPSDKVARLATFSMFVGGLPAVSGIWNLGAAIIPIGSAAGTEKTLDYIQRLGATVVTCTPSFAAHLLKASQDLGLSLRDLPVEIMILGGEPGAQIESIRERLSAGWGADIRDVMGLGEIASGCWAECEAQSGMHFTGHEDVLIELIHPDTAEPLPWEPGAEGELVYTPIMREATPVLRFRSRDHVEVVGTSCACGRTAPKIRVKGRVDDMFIVRGVNVFPTAVRDLIGAQKSDCTGAFRILLRKVEGQVAVPVVIEVEALRSVPEADYSRVAGDLAMRVRERLQFKAEVRMVGDGELPVSTHKTQYVVWQ